MTPSAPSSVTFSVQPVCTAGRSGALCSAPVLGASVTGVCTEAASEGAESGMVSSGASGSSGAASSGFSSAITGMVTGASETSGCSVSSDSDSLTSGVSGSAICPGRAAQPERSKAAAIRYAIRCTRFIAHTS